MATGTPLRSPLRWFGGKGQLMAKILPMIPDHDISVELFGGGASFTIMKRRAPVEILNDIDGDLIHFYRVLQDPVTFDAFCRQIALTPFSRQVWSDCRQTWSTTTDPVDRAYRWFIMARQSFNGGLDSWQSVTNTSAGGMASNVYLWLKVVDRLPELHARLRTVQIECSDWGRMIDRYDGKRVLFYADPPYVFDTRKGGGYRFELTDDQHRTFIDRIQQMQGMVIVSGYDHPIYTPLVDAGWIKHEFKVSAASVGRTAGTGLKGEGSITDLHGRIECVWLSPTCGARQSSMFDLLVDPPADDDDGGSE